MSDARLTSLEKGRDLSSPRRHGNGSGSFHQAPQRAELEVYGDFFFWRGTFGTRP